MQKAKRGSHHKYLLWKKGFCVRTRDHRACEIVATYNHGNKQMKIIKRKQNSVRKALALGMHDEKGCAN